MGFRHRSVWLSLVLALLVGTASTVLATIVRLTGPTTVTGDGRLLIKFDTAFDSLNQVYLVVWGTQAHGPTNGQFLNVDGLPIGQRFTVSSGAEQAGWARVVYSQEEQRFMVAYTKIVPGQPIVHQRAVRFLAYTVNGPSFLTNEVIVDSFTSMAETAGVAYSPAAGVFFVTWHKVPSGESLPKSYVAAVSPTGSILSSTLVSDPNDGESDPSIACTSTGRCLIVGFAWGTPFAPLGIPSLWGRFIDGLGVPVGSNAFYLETYPLLNPPTVAFSSFENKFLLTYDRDFRSVWGLAVDVNGVKGTPFPIKQSAGEASPDGGGWGTSSLSYNPISRTFMMGVATWTGRTGAQELTTTGLVGTTDLLPVTVANDPYPTKHPVSVADPTNNRFLVLDNQSFLHIRSTNYSAGPPPVDTDGDGVVDAIDSCPAVSAPTNDGCPAPGAQLGDVSGDGRPDVVFQNTTTGQLYSWWLSNLALVGQSGFTPATVPSLDWLVVSKDDFTGDGVVDLLLQNQVTGEIQLWPMSGTTLINNTPVTVPVSPGPWRIGATPDLNLDGHPDIVWQRSGTGELYVWWTQWSSSGAITFLGGSLLVEATNFPTFGPGATWKLVAAGDVNSDGKADLVFQDDVTRGVRIWHLGGSLGHVVVDSSVVLVAGAGPWRVRMLNDMNNDGHLDIVWQHATADAEVYGWYLNAGTLIGDGWISTGPLPATWRLVGGK